MKTEKKIHVSPKFTSHTLWTAPSHKVEDQKFEPKMTKALQDEFAKSLAESESALKKKLESFESVEIPDSAARSLVK